MKKLRQVLFLFCIASSSMIIGSGNETPTTYTFLALQKNDHVTPSVCSTPTYNSTSSKNAPGDEDDLEWTLATNQLKNLSPESVSSPASTTSTQANAHFVPVLDPLKKECRLHQKNAPGFFDSTDDSSYDDLHSLFSGSDAKQSTNSINALPASQEKINFNIGDPSQNSALPNVFKDANTSELLSSLLDSSKSQATITANTGNSTPSSSTSSSLSTTTAAKPADNVGSDSSSNRTQDNSSSPYRRIVTYTPEERNTLKNEYGLSDNAINSYCDPDNSPLSFHDAITVLNGKAATKIQRKYRNYKVRSKSDSSSENHESTNAPLTSEDHESANAPLTSEDHESANAPLTSEDHESANVELTAEQWQEIYAQRAALLAWLYDGIFPSIKAEIQAPCESSLTNAGIQDLFKTASYNDISSHMNEGQRKIQWDEFQARRAARQAWAYNSILANYNKLKLALGLSA